MKTLKVEYQHLIGRLRSLHNKSEKEMLAGTSQIWIQIDLALWILYSRSRTNYML